MRAFIRLTALLVFFGSNNPLGAAPVPLTKGPLQLHLRLDRQEYRRWEPIWCDLCLKNVTSRELGVPSAALVMRFRFEVTPEKGKVVELWPSFATPAALEKQVFDRLAPDEYLPGRMFLQDASEREAFATGRFTVRAVCEAGYTLTKSPDDAKPLVLASNPVTFTVLPTTHDEKDTAELIAGLVKKGRWSSWLHDAEKWHQVRAKTRSPRFRACCDLLHGQTEATWPLTVATPPAAEVRERRDSLRATLRSDCASPYMKGLAAHSLALSGYDRRRAGTDYRTAEALRLLIKEHPETCIAADARSALSAIQVIEAKRKAKR